VLIGKTTTAGSRNCDTRPSLLHFVVAITTTSFRLKLKDIFALHKCCESIRSPLAPAHRRALDGDFGIANRDHAEQQRATDPAEKTFNAGADVQRFPTRRELGFAQVFPGSVLARASATSRSSTC
jgi:hypothetical protein